MSVRVLVVDDDRTLADTLAECLGERGFDAIATASTSEAVQLLDVGHIDALVTDLRMPQHSGLDLLAMSLERDPSRPVIVMTAYSSVDSAIESVRLGAYQYLTKPFKVDALAELLQRALG
jgi:two-component system response regulator HydG